jgi:hypothetical protein
VTTVETHDAVAAEGTAAYSNSNVAETLHARKTAVAVALGLANKGQLTHDQWMSHVRTELVSTHGLGAPAVAATGDFDCENAYWRLEAGLAYP